MAGLLQGVINNPKYDVNAKVEVLQTFAPQIKTLEQSAYTRVLRAYTENLKNKTQEKLKFTDFVNKYAQQAASTAQAPEDINEDFKKVVKQVGQVKGKQEDALEALRFLFGEADYSNNSELYNKADINDPKQRDKEQPGAQLKESIQYKENLIST